MNGEFTKEILAELDSGTKFVSPQPVRELCGRLDAQQSQIDQWHTLADKRSKEIGRLTAENMAAESHIEFLRKENNSFILENKAQAEPPAEEFTRRIRQKLLDVALDVGGTEKMAEPLLDLKEACDRLDAQQQKIERLHQVLSKQQRKYLTVKGDLNRLTAENTTLKEQLANRECVTGGQGYCGYSQETMNALVAERDKLKQEIDKLKFELAEQDESADMILADLSRLTAENEQLRGEKPIPNAWWKDCPGLAHKTMERIIEKNDLLTAENKTQAERIAELVKHSIEEEPEYPGDMPDEMKKAIVNDSDLIAEALKATVRLTKTNILNRIEQALKGGK